MEKEEPNIIVSPSTVSIEVDGESITVGEATVRLPLAGLN